MTTVTAYVGECSHMRETADGPCLVCELMDRVRELGERAAGQMTVIRSLERTLLLKAAAERRRSGAA